jgi:pimeloyl-ACP methyl ester carboxylesterase
VYALISNTDPELAPQLLAGLPESVRTDMTALDLSQNDLSALRARLLLVHGRHDPMIPRQESISLAGAVPPGQVHLFVTDALAHVEVQPGLGDYWKLWRAVYALLSERNGVQ